MTDDEPLTEVLTLITYICPVNGTRGWAFRGFGPKYEAFDFWLFEQFKAGKNNRSGASCWPWFYWEFNDPAIDQHMFAAYADCINTDQTRYNAPFTPPYGWALKLQEKPNE
jgi:hypothetical protein